MFKLTLTLAPNVYNGCSIRGGAFLLLSNVLDMKGEGVGTFLDFGVLKSGFWWFVMFRLTSTLAPNVYNGCSIRGEDHLCC